MEIHKDIMASLVFPYAISIFDGKERRVFVGPEKKGTCISFTPDGGDVQTVWEGEAIGGTTGIAQIPGKTDEFLAIEGFYKGLQCEGAGIIHVAKKGDGGWRVRRLCDLPFAHRIAAVKVRDAVFVLVGTLCAGKANREDWSQPGAVHLARWKGGNSLRLEPIGEPIHLHHGMYAGGRDGRHTVLVSGRQGVFEITVPEDPEGDWHFEKLLAEPTGDVFAYDLDGDGVDELVAIKGFHGNEMVVYKRRESGWEEVYSLPISYGHFVWAGSILGKNGIVVGYRRSNAALVMLTKIPDQWRFDVDVIDQHEAPVNMEVLQRNGTTFLFATCEYTHRIVRYTIREG